MPLSIAEKKAVVEEVNRVASGAMSVVAAEYRGMAVEEMTELRAKAREAGVYLRIVPNNLARRAFSGTSFECMSDVLVGPLFLAFSQDEPGSAARLLRDFAKKHEQLEVKALSLSGQLLEASALTRVAKLPTRDEALAKLMGLMQAPITKLVQTFAAPHTKLLRTLVAIRDSKQSA